MKEVRKFYLFNKFAILFCFCISLNTTGVQFFFSWVHILICQCQRVLDGNDQTDALLAGGWVRVLTVDNKASQCGS